MDKKDIVYIDTVEYYSAIKKGVKLCHLQHHGWTLEGIMLSEMSHTEKYKYCTDTVEPKGKQISS